MRATNIAAIASLLAATSSTAVAADLSRVFVSSPSMIRDNRESSSGWYLRGTIGYVDYKRPEADFAAYPSVDNMSREGLSNSAVVGAGLGYRFNANVRADMTLDHIFSSHFKGVVPAFAVASITDKGLLQSSTFMVNGYLDFRSVMGLTPYIGAGIGVAHNIFSRHEMLTYDPAIGSQSYTSLAGGDNFSLAWALMAGVGYQLSSNFTFDLGYRYVSVGDVKTRLFDSGTGADVESVGAHEVRMGIRYSFN